MSDSLKDKALKGSIWSAMERFWVHGVQFLVMLVVARILSPSDYGLVGMLAVFIIVSQTLVDSGFGQALIRKNDRNDVDCNTIFYFNIVLGVFFYLLLYIFAPTIASFYEQPLLESILRVFGLAVILNSFTIVQGALLTLCHNDENNLGIGLNEIFRLFILNKKTIIILLGLNLIIFEINIYFLK